MPISIFIADDHAVVRDGLRLLLEAQVDKRLQRIELDALFQSIILNIL